jgi:hypothetical protein
MTRSEELFFDIRTINNIRNDMACNLLAGTSEYILQFFLYIYNLLIISPGIHVYVYYMVFAKLLKENYFKNLFRTFPYGNINRR